MPTSVTIGGVTYTLPSRKGEQEWASLSSYLVAVATKAFPTTGGTFVMAAELALTTFGIKAPWFKSATASAADAGVVRLASADLIDWRNNAGNANVALGKDATDNLEWNGVDVTTVSGTQTLTNKTLTSPTLDTAILNSPTINNPTFTDFTPGGFMLVFGAVSTTSQGSMGVGVAQKLVVGGPGDDSGSGAQRLILPHACVVKGLSSWTQQAATFDCTVMVQNSGSNTAATYTHTAASQTGSGTGYSVAFAAGDQLGVNITYAGNATQWARCNVCVYCEFA